MGLSLAAQNLYLDRKHATAYGSLIEVGILDGQLLELTSTDCPGYARKQITTFSSLWLPADGGVKRSNDLQFADATGPWDNSGEWDCIFVDGVAFDWAELAEAIVVDAAGTGPLVTLARFYSSLAD